VTSGQRSSGTATVLFTDLMGSTERQAVARMEEGRL